MRKCLVVQAEHSCGRGARGLNLRRFLTIFHGSRNVDFMTVDELRRSSNIAVEQLFVGVPTSLRKDDLTGVRFRQAVLFDYQDDPGPVWLDSDEGFLRSLSDLYLKCWVEPQWQYGLRFGVLPIRRYAKLVWFIRGLRSRGRGLWWTNRCQYDVSFIGNGTSPVQRARWIDEVQRSGKYSFWGGIVTSEELQTRLRSELGELRGVFYPGRVGFLKYYLNLCRSRVALAPAGNAPWSYRLWEAIYMGAVVVAPDFRQIRTLLPLPLDGMCHVPPDQSVLPAVAQALAMRRDQREILADNVRFLERFLTDSDYARSKPMLMDRFATQLEDPTVLRRAA